MGSNRAVALAPLLLGLTSCATPEGNATQRAVHAAKLAEFEAWMAADDSATRALESWCAAQNLARPAKVTARAIATKAPPPSALRQILQVQPGEPLGYRHVVLSCGNRPLSIAHNWFVPARLAPGMAAALATTDTPFGKVVAPLGFRRESLDTEFVPPPECPRATVSVHRAVLRLPDGGPLAYVVECYTPAVLAGRS